MDSRYDVAIVGGGAAGIAAARTLAGSSRSAILLEAGPRLGGRAQSVPHQGVALDLGCGWLHSAERNAWTTVAEASGVAIDRGMPAWGQQFRNLGFSPHDQRAARTAFEHWLKRMEHAPPSSDRASDSLLPDCAWNGHIAAMTGFISGVTPDRISVADYLAYENAATDCNWRLPGGYGTLIVMSMPADVAHHVSTPVESVLLEANGVRLTTSAGDITARAVILTVSTAVLAGNTITLPDALEPWRAAAAQLPLGRNEKLFLAIDGPAPFEAETQVLGKPGEASSASCYIRPLGWPVIECFLGGEGARRAEAEGEDAAFADAIDDLVALFGTDVRRSLRPIIASAWSANPRIGGAYSCALPGHAPARETLALPFNDRIFFAGEATNPIDFSTAHGAHDSGVRAAREAAAALRA
ncbi:FAD-dependent oxidoreductase [Sphingomonas sp. CARO-RG-8B-R24-01]|uniref:flavin monoamine oxidase family protein n=1 Tax=Sphingomonas sp. CARO-RG-8B-R24-01 TaxID=2914831 RepID=UPI001F560FD3|nr:FAD-dependent oxidoreductase [Sphingomonas sp. CARO-RG-8B-R24-01]